MNYSTIFRTSNFDAIQKLCCDAQSQSEMVGLIGYPGAGKTIGLKYYEKENENVIYSVVRKSMSTREFYMNFLNILGYEGTRYNELTIYMIMNIITMKINTYNKKKLLIIDEAGKFKPQQLEYIHELRDLTQHNLGIILSGPSYFYNNIRKWKHNNVIGIPELERRISSFVWLERPSKFEIKSFCHHYKIRDEEIIKNKFYKCNNFGELTNEIKRYLEDWEGE